MSEQDATNQNPGCDYYETSEFRTAAYLLALGEKMTSTRWEGRRAFFKFFGIGLEGKADEFQMGDPLVKARSLFDAQSRLKTIIHQKDPIRQKDR